MDLIYKHLIDLKEDGSFRLNQKYFNYLSGLTMTNGAFDELFGGPPAKPETQADPEGDGPRPVGAGGVRGGHAAHGAHRPHRRPGSRTSAWPAAWRSTASGTAGSCGRARSSSILIQPAAGDAGGALGVAQLIWHRYLEASRARDARQGLDEGVPTSALPSRPRRSRRYLKSAGRGLRAPGAGRAEPARGRRTSPTRRSSAGSTAGWSSGPGPWAPAASSATRGARACRRR